jgi:hypothetical protein
MNSTRGPADLVVDRDYQHIDKQVTPAADAAGAPGLKWYDIHRPDAAIDDEARALARATVLADETLDRDDLGFVLLHRCGESFFFLLICRWRNNNELWLTSYTRDGDGDFGIVEAGTTRAAFCVWELGAVLHEQQAWISYLRSTRDDHARTTYLADRFSGRV